MRAKIAAIPDGAYEGEAFVDSDGGVDEPLRIAMKITKRRETLTFDMSGSSPPCRGPMNSVLATTKSSVYLAIKHIFPDVPINAGSRAARVSIRGDVPLREVPRPARGAP
jgi:N-methylhydantoinase B